MKFVQCKSVPCLLPEATAREIDAIYSTLPPNCDYVRKSYIPDAVHFEANERSEVSILSVATRDLADEVVLPEGLDLDHYRRTKVVLYNHNDAFGPVADCRWIKLLRDNTLRAKTVYPEHPQGQAWPIDHIWELINSGMLRAKSIGFQPLLPKREPTSEELEAHPDWAGTGVWSKGILLEYSICPSGCNKEALIEYIHTKSLDPTKLKLLDIDMPEVAKQVPVVVKQLTQAEAIAIVAQAHKLRPKKKKVNLDQVLSKALEALDLSDMIQQAIDQQRRNPWSV